MPNITKFTNEITINQGGTYTMVCDPYSFHRVELPSGSLGSTNVIVQTQSGNELMNSSTRRMAIVSQGSSIQFVVSSYSDEFVISIYTSPSGSGPIS